MSSTPILWSSGMLITFKVLQIGVLLLTAILVTIEYIKGRNAKR
jgi:hypothetical protein